MRWTETQQKEMKLRRNEWRWVDDNGFISVNRAEDANQLLEQVAGVLFQRVCMCVWERKQGKAYKIRSVWARRECVSAGNLNRFKYLFKLIYVLTLVMNWSRIGKPNFTSFLLFEYIFSLCIKFFIYFSLLNAKNQFNLYKMTALPYFNHRLFLFRFAFFSHIFPRSNKQSLISIWSHDNLIVYKIIRLSRVLTTSESSL